MSSMKEMNWNWDELKALIDQYCQENSGSSGTPSIPETPVPTTPAEPDTLTSVY
jgi:hypothetical protein